MFTFPLSLFSSGFLINGNSILFDGVDEYITAADSASLDIPVNITLGCWFKTTAAGSHAFISKWQPSTADRAYLFGLNAGKVRCIVSALGNGGATDAKDYTTTATFNDGNWHHAVASLDNTGNVFNIYVDGVDQAVTKTFDVNLAGIKNSVAPLNIGAFDSGNSWLMSGNLDEPSLWNTNLSAAEVAAIYNTGTPIDLSKDVGNYVSSSNLAAWWRMGDKDTFPTILDQTANANTGTMTNMESGDIVGQVP